MSATVRLSLRVERRGGVPAAPLGWASAAGLASALLALGCASAPLERPAAPRPPPSPPAAHPAGTLPQATTPRSHAPHQTSTAAAVDELSLEVQIWRALVAALKQGTLTAEQIRPYHDSLRQPMLGFLTTMAEQTAARSLWHQWDVVPEIFRVGDHVHYLAKLSVEGQEVTYCFSVLVDGEEWFFRHLEAIHIRLDKIPELPTSEFPDLPEKTKAHMRIEGRATEQVRLFRFLAKQKGKDFAFDWFRDGHGYLMAAKTWVPFYPPAKAFVLYLCWEQARQQHAHVTLERLTDTEATVALDSWFLEIYERAAHLKQQISQEDYRRLFETIWRDRAEKAGWQVRFSYGRLGQCRLELTRRQRSATRSAKGVPGAR